MKRKKLIISVIVMAVVLIGGYQVTTANFNKNGKVDTLMSAGTLGIEIVDLQSLTKQANQGMYTFSSGLPGSVMTRQIGIENSKDKDLYVRVIVTRYWKNKNDEKVVDANPTFIDILTENRDQWIVKEAIGANQEVLTFYYKQPLHSGEKTTPLMDAIKLKDEITDQVYSGYHANIQMEAEAIQKIGAKDAMLSQWGVEVSLDEFGNIVEIVE